MIRPATVEDTEEAMAMLQDFHQEGQFRSIALDELMVRKLLSTAITSPSMVCLVQSDETGLGGIFIGYTSNFFFSQERGVWDVIFYVRPERRGSPISVYLLDHAVAWAKSVNARALCLGISTGINVERGKRFLNRLGLLTTGGNFMIDLKNLPNGLIGGLDHTSRKEINEGANLKIDY